MENKIKEEWPIVIPTNYLMTGVDEVIETACIISN
jgi:hypothetical protein